MPEENVALHGLYVLLQTGPNQIVGETVKLLYVLRRALFSLVSFTLLDEFDVVGVLVFGHRTQGIDFRADFFETRLDALDLVIRSEQAQQRDGTAAVRFAGSSQRFSQQGKVRLVVTREPAYQVAPKGVSFGQPVAP